MKICVYAICKNEANFVTRWLDSMSEADYICVLDTGSTDGTLDALKQHALHIGVSCIIDREMFGTHTGMTGPVGRHPEEPPKRTRPFRLYTDQKIISPWRFDVARNESVKLIPADTDVCVCTDLDEVWTPGWRAALEKAWTPETEQASYRCVWAYNPDGSEGGVSYRTTIHALGKYEWIHYCHEVLQRTSTEQYKVAFVDGVTLEHRKDPTKSRSNYLPLLEADAADHPDDARCAHYLGREYMYQGRWDKAIAELTRHLSLLFSKYFVEERAASMRFIGRAHVGKGDRQEAFKWFMRACAEAPHLRECWWEAEENAYYLSDYISAQYFGIKATEIKDRAYISEPRAWGAEPWDILAVSAWKNGNGELALSAAEKAAKLAPNDTRMNVNYEYIKSHQR